jgi:hypothetical protein
MRPLRSMRLNPFLLQLPMSTKRFWVLFGYYATVATIVFIAGVLYGARSSKHYYEDLTKIMRYIKCDKFEAR